MKKVLGLVVAAMLIAGVASAGTFAVQGGFCGGCLGGGIKANVAPGVGIEVNGGLVGLGLGVGAGLDVDVYSVDLDPMTLNVYVGGNFVYILTFIPAWSAVGKGGVELLITDTFAVFGGGGGGVVGGSYTLFGTTYSGIVPTGYFEGGVRYYIM